MDFLTMTGMLGNGFLVSFQIFALTLLGSLPLGMLVAFARMSRFKPLALLARFYISIMRGTPLMLQMFAIYFMPYYVFGINLTTDSKWQATIVAFIVNYAAYFAEIFRGGLQSIPRGQREAGKALGFSRVQIFFRILLPQLFKRSLLPVSNEVVTLVKDTALVTCIALCDMYYYAKKATSATGSLLPLFLAGAFYLLMNTVVEVVFDRLNKRMDYYRG